MARTDLWLIDERLAFHDHLASDKRLSSMPIADCAEKLERKLCVLNVFDVPLLVSDDRYTPLASIVIVEFQRPYFGHNDNYRACIEVLSCDRLLQAARQRNGAFFDKLGLPTP